MGDSCPAAQQPAAQVQACTDGRSAQPPVESHANLAQLPAGHDRFAQTPAGDDLEKLPLLAAGMTDAANTPAASKGSARLGTPLPVSGPVPWGESHAIRDLSSSPGSSPPSSPTWAVKPAAMW